MIDTIHNNRNCIMNVSHSQTIERIASITRVHDVFSYFDDQISRSGEATFLNQLKSLINTLDDLYYNDGTSPLTDTQYDMLIQSTSIRFPEYEYKSENSIGSNVKTGDAVILPYFMGSMNKFKETVEVERWSKLCLPPYTITAKLDGISGLYHKNRLYTRGNGCYGRDISFLIPFLGIPTDFSFAFGLGDNFALRGELIIKKSVFEEKYKDKYANARNLVCGLLNRTFSKDHIEMYIDVEFVSYDVYHTEPLQFCNKIKMMSETTTVVYKDKVRQLDVCNLNIILNDWKTSCEYEIDGIIITNDKPCIHPLGRNPDFAFAYKNNVIGVEIQEGIVEKVVWNISKDNYLKPKIKLCSSISCNGSNIEYVTGFNARYILRNGICFGTKLRIGLSGNVIPHIFSVVNNDAIKYLDLDLTHPKISNLLKGIDCESYSWNKNQVDLISNDISNPYAIIKQNTIFFNSFGLKCSLQETTLKNVYESLNIFKLTDVLSLDETKWVQVEKVASKKARKIITCLKNNLDWRIITKDKTSEEIDALLRLYFIRYLIALPCFPRGFGKKKIESHIHYLNALADAGKFSVKYMYTPGYLDKVKSIIEGNVNAFKVKQVTFESIQMFCVGFEQFLKTFTEIDNHVDTIIFPPLVELISSGLSLSSKLKDSQLSTLTDVNKMNVVFSGIRDKIKESEFIRDGYIISDTVNEKTHVLFVKTMSSVSVKMKKAIQLGIKIIALN